MLLNRAQRTGSACSQHVVSLGPLAAPSLQEVEETERSSMLAAKGIGAQAARPEADVLHALASALQVAQPVPRLC